MAGLRRLDAFVKTRPDVRSKSVAGGIITLVAATAAAALFVAQMALYIKGETKHSLHLSPSTPVPLLPLNASPLAKQIADRFGKIPLSIHVTFPHLKCNQLDVIHDGAALSTGDFEKIHKKHSIKMRSVNPSEAQTLSKLGVKNPRSDGCTITGEIRIPVVAGTLAITMTQSSWVQAASLMSMGLRDSVHGRGMSSYNVSHYIHHVRFGETFPLAADKPLESRPHFIQNDYGGIALEQIQVKLVPTAYERFFSEQQTYQTSVVDHTVQPQTLVAHGVPSNPGVIFAYDFTPLAVRHSEGRDNFVVFLSSLVSIVGGVFVTVGLVTGCLVHSAQAVAKKID